MTVDQPYLAANRHVGNFSLNSAHELRAFSIEKLRVVSVNSANDQENMTYVELLRRLAQGSVVLLNKVPADLIFGEIVAGTGRVGGIDGCGSGVLIGGALVLLLVGEVAVCSHCELLGSARPQVWRNA